MSQKVILKIECTDHGIKIKNILLALKGVETVVEYSDVQEVLEDLANVRLKLDKTIESLEKQF